MAVTYVALPASISRDRELVSEEWAEFLTAAQRAGVGFNVNEGRRTLARQAHFYALYRAGRGNLAAFPSPTAPHIRVGRIDHAIDVDGSGALIEFGHKNGVTLQRTVRGESWHLEASRDDLIRFAARFSPTPTLRKGVVNRSAVRELQTLLKKLGSKGFTVNGRYDLPTRQAVRRWQDKHGMTVDGIVDEHLWARLRKATA